MQSATDQLIELAEALTPSGEIGDGMVAQFHELARLTRVEQQRLAFAAGFSDEAPDVAALVGKPVNALHLMGGPLKTKSCR